MLALPAKTDYKHYLSNYRRYINSFGTTKQYLLVSEKDKIEEFGSTIETYFAGENNALLSNNLIDYCPTLMPLTIVGQPILKSVF